MGKRESVSPASPQRFSGRDAPRDACAAARAFASSAGLEAADADRLCILIEELVLNAVEHGGAGMVEIAFALDGQDVSISFADSGLPFDVQAAPAGPVREDRGGGAGLAIIRTWAQVTNYRRAAGANRATLLMPLRR